MFQTLKNALKIKDIRRKLVYTFLALIVVRLGSQLIIPGVNADNLKAFFDSFSSKDFFDAFTGGGFSQMSIFTLSITPYITSSIIIQLLTIAIPKLEEMQKDGEDGRKKLSEATRYVAVVLAIVESLAMAIGFSQKNVIDGDWKTIVLIVLSMTAGSTYLMWLGERITEKGVGNGISIILLINIVSRIPNDMMALYTQFIRDKENRFEQLIALLVIAAVILFVVFFVVVLSDAERRIPVQYAKKTQGRKQVGGQSTYIPLKVNTAGVIPVIFTTSILQLPILISGLFGIQPASGKGVGVWPKILKLFSSSSWFNVKSGSEFKYTLGVVIYLVLLVFFAYFYTSITFNPIEVANNMKKNGGFIPGIRPGKATTEYLTSVLNRIILIGVTGLAIVAIIPLIFGGVFNANVSFGGTSIIIIVGVVIETMKQIESQMLVRHYKGFLSE